MSMLDHFKDNGEMRFQISKDTAEYIKGVMHEDYPMMSIDQLILFAVYSHYKAIRKNKRKSAPVDTETFSGYFKSTEHTSINILTNKPDQFLEVMALSMSNLRKRGYNKKNRCFNTYLFFIIKWLEKKITTK